MSSSGTDKKYRKAFLRGYTDFRGARISSRAWGLFNCFAVIRSGK